jgi:hypothetical protein
MKLRKGGDWGALVVDQMGVQAQELIGIHTNQPGAVPSDVFKAAVSGGPASSGSPTRKETDMRG